MQLVVLAAGMGSRYSGLKQLDLFGKNKNAIMEFSIFDAMKAGFTEVLFIIRRDIERDFYKWVQSCFGEKIKYELVFQELENLPEKFSFSDRNKPWGTVHALYCAKNKIKDDFIIINADDFYGSNSYKNAYNFLKNNDINHALLAYNIAETLSTNGAVTRGVCNVLEGQVSEIRELKKIQKLNNGKIFYYEDDKEFEIDHTSKVSMNFFAFRKEIINYIDDYLIEFLKSYKQNNKDECFIPLMISDLIQNKTIIMKCIDSEEKWFGVTYKDDKDMVNQNIDKLVAQGVYPEKLWN